MHVSSGRYSGGTPRTSTQLLSVDQQLRSVSGASGTTLAHTLGWSTLGIPTYEQYICNIQVITRFSPDISLIKNDKVQEKTRHRSGSRKILRNGRLNHQLSFSPNVSIMLGRGHVL